MSTADLKNVKTLFVYYKTLGEKTFSQLEEKDLFWQYNQESNSIAIIVQHLWGNMLSRWTDFLTTDGEKVWRNRDQEFEPVISSRTEMMEKWNAGWQVLFEALDSVTEDNSHTPVYIRNQEHSIADAVTRQLAHYASHIGQIVYIGRMIRGGDWESLSIPKGGSEAFNREKFERGKHGGHFADDLK